ncbi:hypothetical protein DFH08DRAFT_830315 [Mycena albidolilacea]|uniref:DUF2423 domain-containing protein n=1 Tax=Mycena albidolilacea TaxID=1033008 RepID=A0AAD7AUC2_9AGAR|nr:hypothetical protein DFH08DRAFT_830315 [Mycena albidolilacea]
MAKSTRSKVKRSFRASKRETGIYAATEAARLNRLHAKLSAVASRDIPQDEEEGAMEGDDELRAEEANPDAAESMQVDGEGSSKKISTHGPRGSRREEWRTSKGLTAKPTPTGMNRQGGVAARRKAGRSKRRR